MTNAGLLLWQLLMSRMLRLVFRNYAAAAAQARA